MSLADPSIPRHRREFTNASVFAVEVGTNGPQGGDAGHGSRVEVTFEDLAGTAWEVEVDGPNGYPSKVTLRFGGDAEGANFLEALRYVVKALEREWTQR